jgi:hypothetical protein
MKKSKSLVTLVILGTWAGLANAQYVVVLKNGRQLTVQSYREEGSTVKIQGLGGELGIPKEQIQSISKSGQSDRPGLNLNNLETASRSGPVAAKPTPSASASRPSEVSGSTDVDSGVSADEERDVKDWPRLHKTGIGTETLFERLRAAVRKSAEKACGMDRLCFENTTQKAGGGPRETPLAVRANIRGRKKSLAI